MARLSMNELVAQKFLTQAMAEVVKACAKARVNIIVSGVKQSGKTTFLSAIRDEVAAELKDTVILDDADATKVGFLVRRLSAGWIATMETSSVRSCVDKLRSALVSAGLDSAGADQLVANSVEVIVQVAPVDFDNSRRIGEIAEVTGLEGNFVALGTLFNFETECRCFHDWVPRHVGSGLPPKFLDKIEAAGVPFKLEWLR